MEQDGKVVKLQIVSVYNVLNFEIKRFSLPSNSEISICSLLSGTRLVKNVSEPLQAATTVVHMALSYVFSLYFILIMKLSCSATKVAFAINLSSLFPACL